MGWKTRDKFNNDINFLINIISTNKIFDDKEFIIPKLNQVLKSITSSLKILKPFDL